jgi:cytidyltransferase-like protein
MSTSRKVVCTSGGYDPFPHVGHVAGFYEMKKLGHKLVVIVNNDSFLRRKHGVCYTPMKERMQQISALKPVDEVVGSIDTDDLVCETLKLVNPDIFAKSGDDWNIHNIPHRVVLTCDAINCEIVTGLAIGYPQHNSDIVRRIARLYDNSKGSLPSKFPRWRN